MHNNAFFILISVSPHRVMSSSVDLVSVSKLNCLISSCYLLTCEILFLAREKRFLQSVSLNAFRDQALRRHNDKRKMHCVNALTIDTQLNQRSQDLADNLAAADKLPPKYKPIGLQNVYFDEAEYALLGRPEIFSVVYLKLYLYSKAHIPLIAFTEKASITIRRTQT